MATYYVMHNRTEGPVCQTDDLEHAGQIVHAMMMTREAVEPCFEDYWVRADCPDHGPEFYWHKDYRTVFSAGCGEGDA